MNEAVGMLGPHSIQRAHCTGVGDKPDSSTPPGSCTAGLVLLSDSAWQGSQHPSISDTQGLDQGHLYSGLGTGAEEW